MTDDLDFAVDESAAADVSHILDGLNEAQRQAVTAPEKVGRRGSSGPGTSPTTPVPAPRRARRGRRTSGRRPPLNTI